jgi:hypothetical protein
VVVIMVRHKKKKVHGSHRCPEPWMKGIFEYCLFVDGFQQRYGLCPDLPEPQQEFGHGRVVMAGLRRTGVLQVGGTQFFLARNNIIQPALPQRLQVAQMSKVLLDGPGVIWLMCQQGGVDGHKFFFQPDWGTSQPLQNGGKNVLGSREVELSFEPFYL